jgi:hypothetical protein
MREKSKNRNATLAKRVAPLTPHTVLSRYVCGPVVAHKPTLLNVMRTVSAALTPHCWARPTV